MDQVTKSSAPILITGVGKRIGYAIANHFLAQGVPVIGTYRSKYPELKLLKEQGCFLYHCDFYQQPQIEGLINTIKKNHPELRAIIHNASDWLADLNELDTNQTFSRMMQIHAGIPYQLNIALATQLNHDKSMMTDIIHISDYVAQSGSSKHIIYAASKAAMENMTLSFAVKLAPNVKVNSIAPALIEFQPDDDEDYKVKALDKSLLKKTGGTKEMLSSIDYLMASSYMTGRVIHLDGGRHLR